ncbi:ComEA family DNA-binding protein [Gemmatimonas phototrophica]|uniref:ComEA family DNA-binding protein n=1 Tax=Gemmatimonas phototrophica TaxID=1379270 RepID=UPI0006A6D0B0|nr:ComEA family DNA-binding protein [Gemmatimonas phototrophica]
MATKQERLALSFITGIALTAVGVRAVGVQRFDADVAKATRQAPDSGLAQRALAAQVAAVDSAARAPRRRKSGVKRPSLSLRQKAPTPSRGVAPTPPPRVDVNAATAQELETLPRVGPALAKRIVEWRDRHGPFSRLEELRHVRGIGPSTVRLLDSLVTFSGRPSPLDSEGTPSPAYHHESVF